MKKLTQLGLLFSALSFAGSSLAGNDSGFYVGGSVGNTDFDYSHNSVSFDDDDAAYKAFGGYNFGLVPFLDIAAEISYIDFGSASIRSGDYSTDLDAATAAAIVGFNLGPVGLFGKAGVADWNSDLRISEIKDSDSGTDAFYGLGAKVQFGSIGVRAEYERFDLDKYNLNLYTVGASYTF